MSQKVEIDGEEVEVFTSAEVAERETAARTAVEGEYKPKLDELNGKLTDAEKRAAERAGEFAQFRKLSDDAIAKLSVAERTIYENSLALDQANKRNEDTEKERKTAIIDAAIRARVGTDQKLFDKVKGMYELVNLGDTTAEQIATRVAAALGAIGSTEPDLLASAGFAGGSFEPPRPAEKATESFADTEGGKNLAGQLGITLEEPKKN